MSQAGWYVLFADLLLVLHVLFVLFAVFGFTLIVVGRFASWGWIYHRAFRVTHLAAIVFVVVQAWLGRLCPLTIWENALRVRAGQGAYQASFIRHWLQRFLYYDAEPWVFVVVYTLFGAFVLLFTIIDWKTIRLHPHHRGGRK